jgi:hypothetical protein
LVASCTNLDLVSSHPSDENVVIIRFPSAILFSYRSFNAWLL